MQKLIHLHELRKLMRQLTKLVNEKHMTEKEAMILLSRQLIQLLK